MIRSDKGGTGFPVCPRPAIQVVKNHAKNEV